MGLNECCALFSAGGAAVVSWLGEGHCKRPDPPVDATGRTFHNAPLPGVMTAEARIRMARQLLAAQTADEPHEDRGGPLN
jgi:hypothetical protein